MQKYLEKIQKINESPLLNLKIVSNDAVAKINLTLDHDNNDNDEKKSKTYIINVNVHN